MANLLTNSTFNTIRVATLGSDTNIVAGRCAWGTTTSVTGLRNTIFGYKALAYGATGTTNTTAVGYKALYSSGTHCSSTAIGAKSMYNAYASTRNTAVGFGTLDAVSSCYNTAIGSCAGAALTNGGSNTFVGFRAGSTIGEGNSNTGIGAFALTAAGTNANGNIAVGFCALANAQGDNNIAVGYKAGFSVNNASNTISIGCCSTAADFDNHTAAGNSGCSTFCVGIGWTTLSDCRDKTDIETLDTNLGLNFIRKLRPVKYNFDFRDKYVRECNFEYGTKDGTLANEKKSYGFIAQEMETALTEVSSSFDALNYNSDEDHYRLIYTDLIAPVIQAVQDTLTRLETLENLQSNG